MEDDHSIACDIPRSVIKVPVDYANDDEGSLIIEILAICFLKFLLNFLKRNSLVLYTQLRFNIEAPNSPTIVLKACSLGV